MKLKLFLNVTFALGMVLALICQLKRIAGNFQAPHVFFPDRIPLVPYYQDIEHCCQFGDDYLYPYGNQT